MKILFVCLGNICRSPLAEGMLQQLANESNLNWQVDSAGTGNWHIGSAPDYRSIAAAKNKGYNISRQRAQQFDKSMFAEYDLIFAMDNKNLIDLTKLANNEADINKLKLFLESSDVTDPYFDDTLFASVANQIEERCKSIIKAFFVDSNKNN